MYIKSMVLEGFKSYAKRTEIYGFDNQFTAITGLNGSGKSNILDGICFLLGISNLNHVRALNLNELVYKNGQGGINKATVSITFDNSNKDQTPLGYTHLDEFTITRQITIGNRNKYMINGVSASNQRVTDLFRSVQLNVNNPHFLIMQGRITKVLNMKPEEILSMVEEATGTRLYENKKETIGKLIFKKDARFSEIDKQINEELNPSLMKLKEERSAYIEFQKINRELEQLHKFYTAYKYYGIEKMQRKLLQEQEELEKSLESTGEDIVKQSAEKEEIKKLVLELEKKKDKEEGGKLENLNNKLEAARLEEARVNGKLKTSQITLKSDEEKLDQLRTQIRNDDASLLDKRQRLKELQTGLVQVEEEVIKDKKAHSEAIEHLRAVKIGSTSSEGGKKQSTTQEQLRNAQMSISNAETQVKDTTLKLKHGRAELKKAQDMGKQQDESYKKDQTTLNKLTSSIKKLEEELSQLPYSEEKENAVMAEYHNTEASLHHLTSKLQALQARLHQVQFEYDDPERGWDRRRVKGLVANLVSVKDAANATALETIAGGKLYQVVADNEQTAKMILEKGNLKKRVTFIPLNKINGSTINPSVVHRAKQLVGEENVEAALSLVSYEDGLQRAMAYVFGSSFVCSNMDAAKKVTFNDSIKKRSVTLEGNSFDPAGIASGGALQKTDILLRIASLKESQADYDSCQHKLKKLNVELKKMQEVAGRWRDLSDRLDIQKNELKMLQEKLKNSAFGQKLQEIEGQAKKIKEMEDLLEKAQKEKNENEEMVREFEEQLRDFEGHQKREEKKATDEMARCKKVEEGSAARLKQAQEHFSLLRLEVADLEKEQEEANEQITSLKSSIQEVNLNLQQIKLSLSAAQEKVSKCAAMVNEHKAIMLVRTKEIEEKSKFLCKLNEALESNNTKVTDLSHQITQKKKLLKDHAKQLEQMRQREEWIDEEKVKFNQADSIYDFRTVDLDNIKCKIGNLEEVKSKLSKKVNTRAMTMLTNAEAYHTDVMSKRPIVIKDRSTIKEYIIEVDDRKQQTLKKAVEHVNQNFGSIFSTLLPGTLAKLEPVMDGDVLKGLMFKVGFGDLWKESLSELSGGQRSLVALSLILSLLLYKPAPLYILDEVDAALDLSHTQNIGEMLKAHFQNSQFIIVSLKEGMFNNANVLFRTNFNEGVSSVDRITQKASTSNKHSKAPLSRNK